MMAFLLSPMVILIVAAAVAWSGLVLLIAAMVPRREGATRYCRKCGYDLTGTTGDICSECGADLTLLKAVVVGQRLRKRGRVIVALSMLLIGLMPLGLSVYATWNGIYWYRHYPTFFVLHDLQSSQRAVATRAYDEIMRRSSAGTLSPKDINRLAEICLEEQAQPEECSPIGTILVDHLGGMYSTHELMPAQSDRMFANFFQDPELRARSPIPAGHCLPLSLSTRDRIPDSFQVFLSGNGFWIDGQEIHNADTDMELSFEEVDLNPTMYRSMPITQPGTHHVSLKMHYIAVHYIVPPQGQEKPFNERIFTVETDFELLADEPADYIRMIRSTEVDQAVTNAIRLGLANDETVDWNGQPGITLAIEFSRTLPVNVAFELFVEDQGTILGKAVLGCHKDRGCRITHLEYIDVPGELPESVDVRLVASPAAAATTMDMFEIWGGELLFQNIEMPHGQATSPSLVTHRPVLVSKSQDDSE